MTRATTLFPSHGALSASLSSASPPQRVAFTVSEVAGLAGCCRDTIYGAIREKRLIARKLGKRTVILRGDLDNFLHSLPTLNLDDPNGQNDDAA